MLGCHELLAHLHQMKSNRYRDAQLSNRHAAQTRTQPNLSGTSHHSRVFPAQARPTIFAGIGEGVALNAR